MTSTETIPRNWTRACQGMLAVGVIAFAAALAMGQAQRAWQAFLINLVFWTGIAQCGVVFSAAYQVSRGKWGDAFRRMGESLGWFLPVAAGLLLVLMLFGARSVFVWAREPAPGKEAWLNVPFVTVRDFAAIVIVAGLSAVYVYYSQRPALYAAVSAGAVPESGFVRWWTEGAGSVADDERCAERVRVLAPMLIIAFGLCFSLIAFDLVMSLDPTWYSTLFGWYSFVAMFYSALAFLVIAAAVLRKRWQLEEHLRTEQSHDIGRLLFGFCLLTGGLFWAQWLVFWYGDLPEETKYVIHRYYEMPFAPFAWTMTYGAFLVPLVILLSKALKKDLKRLVWVAVWILAMLWLERYVWIVPSIWKGTGAPLVIEILITAGFLGGFVWGWMAHNRRIPVAAISALPVGAHH